MFFCIISTGFLNPVFKYFSLGYFVVFFPAALFVAAFGGLTKNDLLV